MTETSTETKLSTTTNESLEFECIVCKCEIDDLRELVVCGTCHSAYHRDCLKLAFSDRKSHFYHSCANCTRMFSFSTLLKMNEVSKYELFNGLFAQRSERISNVIRSVTSIFKSIETSYVPHENTYALLCMYMDVQRLNKSDGYVGMQEFIRLQFTPANHDLIFAVVEAMKNGLFFIHSNFGIAQSQWPMLRQELMHAFSVLNISQSEFFDIYDLVSTESSNRKFENLQAPKVDSSTSIKTIWGDVGYPRFKHLFDVFKSMIDARMKQSPFPRFVKYISRGIQHLCSRLDCDGVVVNNECLTCKRMHCSRCGKLEHEGLCEAEDMIQYGLIQDHKVICHNCRSYIKRTIKNLPNKWYCPICRKAFMIKEDSLYEVQPTFDQLIESISHDDVKPLIDNIFEYSSRTCMQLLSHLKRINVNMQSNIFYQFAQVFIQESHSNHTNFINDMLISNAISKKLDLQSEAASIPFSKSLHFMIFEFPGIIKNDLIALMKGIASGESFDKSLDRMSAIMRTHNDIISMYKLGIPNEGIDYYTKQLLPLIRKDDIKMQEWAKQNLM